MHVVTKILIVFCAILSLLLAALSMAYSANADAVRSSFKSEEAAKIAAQAYVKAQESQWTTERANIEKDLAAANQAAVDREKAVVQLQTERSQLRTELEQAKASLQGVQNRIDQLAATTETQAGLNRAYRDEVTKLRTDLLEASRREIELTDRINDLDSAREVLEQTARALKEQLAEAQLALQSAKEGNVPGAVGLPTVPLVLVRGRVTEVFKSPASEEMVVIDVGSNSGLKENMRLNITRAGSFLAYITLVKVEPQKSVGRVTLHKDPSTEVKPEDIVLSKLD